jgi:hypothetical protein
MNMEQTGTWARRLLLAMTIALSPAVLVAQVGAEQQSPPGAAPDAVLREVADIYNSPGTIRTSGSYDIPAEREISGDVAITAGQLTIAGRVTGRVVAINSDVTLAPSARIGGDLLVIGGRVNGLTPGAVRGRVRQYDARFPYRMENDRLVPLLDEESTWERFMRRRAQSTSKITLRGETYNRVEGLPVHIGPSLRHSLGEARLSADLLGIVRSADGFRLDGDNLGHLFTVELKSNPYSGAAVRARLYDEVAPVERWHLRDQEVGLASFFLRRDFRDYYNRHGGAAELAVYAGTDAELRFSYADERWDSRRAQDPWTFVRANQAWRANPEVDEGRMHLASASLRVDTRNARDNPWAGWYVNVDVERGNGRLASPLLPDASEKLAYTRGFLDLRRYNRLAPNAQFNMRAVVGGWLGGDPLPLQRRLSVGGPGTLPGFDFRRHAGGTDVGQCSSGAAAEGMPAMCERVALFQVEYRGELPVDIFGAGNEADGDWREYGWHPTAQWVVFADAGRGWLVGPRQGTLQYDSDILLPPLSTFRTDLGVGVDVGVIGLFLAKAVSTSKEPANFFIRLRHRF